MKDYKIDLSLEDFKDEEDAYTFTAKSITKDFVCEKGLNRISNDSAGKHLVWRHEHLVNPRFVESHIYGRVLESQVKDGYLITKYQGYKHTPEHLKVYEDIKRRDNINHPLSISVRYRQYGPDNAPIHFDVIEHSLTPTPACKECVILDIKNESENMADLEQELKKIAKLEEELTLKNKTMDEMEKKVVALEKQIKDAESKDVELESEKKEKKELVDKVISISDKLNEQAKTIDKLNETIKMKEIEPLVKRIVDLDGKNMEALYMLKAREAIKDEKFEETKKFFLDRINQKETEITHAVPEDLASTAAKAQKKDEELEDDKLSKARDLKAFAHMPKEFWEKRGAK